MEIMVRLAVAFLFLLSFSFGALVFKGSPLLQDSRQDPAAIRRAKAEMLKVSDSVVLNNIAGNADLTQINSKGDMMFWWFINKIGTTPQTDNSPVILWLQGGPGCSSLIGNLWELGPWSITMDVSGPIVLNRTGTWATQYHLLFVDNPVGTGFSIAGSNDDYVTDEYQMSTNLYALLQNLTIIHPEFFTYNNRPRDLYIFGESYAGKYVPSIADYILQWNANASQTTHRFLGLQGIGISSGFVDPLYHVTSFSDYAMATGLIDESERQQLELNETQAAQYIQQQNWTEATDAWETILNGLQDASGGVSIYNTRTFGYYNYWDITYWLNQPATQKMLHLPTKMMFDTCSSSAFFALQEDMMKSVADLMPGILSRIRVLLYGGQDDLVVNSVGAESWVASLNWTHQQEYLNAPRSIWYNQGQIAGYVRGAGNLLQVNMLKAGHSVAYDQLDNTLAMVTNFITQADWGTSV